MPQPNSCAFRDARLFPLSRLQQPRSVCTTEAQKESRKDFIYAFQLPIAVKVVVYCCHDNDANVVLLVGKDERRRAEDCSIYGRDRRKEQVPRKQDNACRNRRRKCRNKSTEGRRQRREAIPRREGQVGQHM